jgi:hypothetical protein
MPRPTGFPDWAAGSPTAITEPTQAKKALGWVTAEEPPAQYMNWLQRLNADWLRYLSYETVVDDDFAYGANLVGDGPTLYPFWQAEGPDAANQGIRIEHPSGTAFLGQPCYDANGVLMILAGQAASGYTRLLRRVGGLGPKSFLFESRLKFVQVPTTAAGGTGSLSWGLFGGGSGVSPIAGFVTTGGSYMVAFQWMPSGAGAPTAVSVYRPTGLLDTSATGYYWFAVERASGVLNAWWNNTMVASLNGPMDIDQQQFTVGALAYSNRTGSIRAYVDKFKLGVQRPR